MFSLFPQDDLPQTLILKRFFMAFGSYFIAIGLGLLSLASGDNMLSANQVPYIFIGVFLSNLYFYLLIRTGANRRYKDPSITAPQIIVALAWMLLLLFVDTQNRGLFLSVYTIIMMFGIFRLQRTQMLKLATLAFAGYLAVVLIDIQYFPHRFIASHEMVRIPMLAAMLLWASFFAGSASALREKLKRRNRDLSVALEEIGKLASHDDLTNTYNRRYIMDALAQEKSRGDRTQSTFSVVLLDLDHFKTINDRYGHLSGDRVLMAFSERIKGTLRGMDMVDYHAESRFFGRYGGEEFIVVLPGTPLAGAMRCAERIRKVTDEQAFDEVFKVSLSAGVSQYIPGEEIEETLRRADAALYEAKHRGRNRVVGEDNHVSTEYEIAVGENTQTNIVVGPFGAKR